VTSNVNSIGQASAALTLPSNLAPGSYTLQAEYKSTNGSPIDTTGTEPVTITSTPVPPVTTTLTPGSMTIPFSASKVQPIGIPVLVSANNQSVTTGTVTVVLQNLDGTTAATGMGTITAALPGQVTVSLSVPAGFAAGTYNLVESYHDSTGVFNDSSGIGHLTITSPASTPQSPLPVAVVNTPLSTTGTVTNTVSTTSTTSNSLADAIALFFDVMAFVWDQSGHSSISAALHLPTNTTDAFNFAVAQFNLVGGTLGATVIPMATQTAQDVLNSLNGH
jgi:hypothetical protein